MSDYLIQVYFENAPPMADTLVGEALEKAGFTSWILEGGRGRYALPTGTYFAKALGTPIEQLRDEVLRITEETLRPMRTHREKLNVIVFAVKEYRLSA
jgi:hypothetical protein